MKRYYVSPDLIDTILLTHLHGDHFSGIPFFLLDSFYVQKRTDPLHIIGPAGTEQKVFQSLELFYPGIKPEDFSYYIKFKEYESNESFTAGPLHIQAFPVIHAPGAKPHGFRIAFENKILAFSGDTSWTDTLVKIADNADFFMCECNFFETKNSNHLNYKEIIEKRGLFNCKKIVLNHLGDEMLSSTEKLTLPIAEEGEIFEV